MLQSVLRHRTILTFLLCCIAITAVSVHDAVLVVLHEEVISEFEQNPLGCWLIRLQGGEVWLFVWTKLVGTALVAAVLVKIYQHHSRLALTVAAPTAVFQLILLLYLSLR